MIMIKDSISVLLPKMLLYLMCFTYQTGHVNGFNLKGRLGEGYYLQVQIGSPPQKLNVLLDTGSANFAVAAKPHPNINIFFNCSRSNTCEMSDKTVSVAYTQGSWNGRLGHDLIYFPDLGLKKVGCDIALIENADQFYIEGAEWQGIVGLAYPSIVQPDRKTLTWIEAILKHEEFKSLAFSMELCGYMNDSDDYIGNFEVIHNSTIRKMFYSAPVIREWFYDILLIGMSVGGKYIPLDCKVFNRDKTIIDSGTTNLRLPTKVFKMVLELIRSTPEELDAFPKEFWTEQEEFCFNYSQWLSKYPAINISVAQWENTYFIIEIPPESYIRAVHNLNKTLDSQYCYKFAIEESDSETVLGTVVMEGFLVLFNRTNKTVSFAESDCGPSTRIYGPYFTSIDFTSCSPFQVSFNALRIAGYVISAVLSIVGLFLLGFLCQCIWDSSDQTCVWEKPRKLWCHKRIV